MCDKNGKTDDDVGNEHKSWEEAKKQTKGMKLIRSYEA